MKAKCTVVDISNPTFLFHGQPCIPLQKESHMNHSGGTAATGKANQYMATATGSDYPNGCEYLQEIVLSSCI
jgi:hypothetical protein